MKHEKNEPTKNNISDNLRKSTCTLIIEDCQMVGKQNYDKRHQYQESVLLFVDIVYFFSSVYFDFTYLDISAAVPHGTF